MPNPYHYRAHIDRLWRTANSDIPAYKQLKALKALVREMFPPNPNAARNNRLYHATDPYDVARHLLRDLHDRPSESLSPAAHEIGARSLRPPLPLGEGWGEGSPTEDEPPEEDDDPW